MTPEDIDRLHAQAIKRGWAPDRLEELRAAAIRQAGGKRELARWMTTRQLLEDYVAEIERTRRSQTPRP